MPNVLIDLNGQVRLSRTQKGYTWEVVVPVLGVGPGAFTDAVRIALDVDSGLEAVYGPLAAEPAGAPKAK